MAIQAKQIHIECNGDLVKKSLQSNCALIEKNLQSNCTLIKKICKKMVVEHKNLQGNGSLNEQSAQ